MSDGINEQEERPVTQFVNVMGDDLTPEQVEDEVLEAVKEGKEATIEVKQKEAIVDEVTVEVEKPTVGAKLEEATEEAIEEGHVPLPPQPYQGKVAKPSKSLIAKLRLRDTPSRNKTCSSCGTRVPLNEINGGHADVCDKCKG